MMRRTAWWMVAVCVVLLAVSASAQFRMEMPGPRGVWAPKVGAGAVYQVEGKRMGKMKMEMAVVGEEQFQGKPGHWLETYAETERGEMVSKMLLVKDGDKVEPKRMIVQPPGMDDPIEFDPNAMPQGRPPAQKADIKDDAELVGTETITVPAGTFTCQHYKLKDNGGDVWVATDVTPYGMVRMTSPDMTMTLVKVLSNAKTRIHGTPRKFDPAEMMRQRP